MDEKAAICYLGLGQLKLNLSGFKKRIQLHDTIYLLVVFTHSSHDKKNMQKMNKFPYFYPFFDFRGLVLYYLPTCLGYQKLAVYYSFI